MASIDNIVDVQITVVGRTATSATKRVAVVPPPPTITRFVQENLSSGAVEVNSTSGAVQMKTG